MSDTPPHEHVKTAAGRYAKAHETIREHAARLSAERWALINAGAARSAEVDQAVATGAIHAGSTLNPDAPS